MAACVGLGLAVRSVGGGRIPGYNNNHGYGIVANLLGGARAIDSVHGAGLQASHGLTLTVLPRTEASIVAIQVLCSVLTIPVTWALARVLIGSGAAAWAALTMTVLPAPVFYAATEIHQIPGALLLTSTILLLALAIRERDLWILAASFLSAAAAMQFVSVMLMLPGVMFLYAVAIPGSRQLFRESRALILTALFIAAWIPLALQVFTLIDVGGSTYTRMVPTPLQLIDALQVRTGDQSGNRWLNPSFTPPTFALLSLIGVVCGLRRRAGRGTTAALLLTALLFTAVQLYTLRMDAMRHQLIAQSFYAILTGRGVQSVLDYLAARWPRIPGRLRTGLATAVVLGSVALWSGPTWKVFTPQLEHRFVASAVATVPDDCTILFPGGKVVGEVPSYLSAAAGRRHQWTTVADPILPASLPSGCLLWYRPSSCWDCESFGPEERAPGCEKLRAECRRAEEQLRVEPRLTATIPALPDAHQKYSQPMITIGLFRVIRPTVS